MKKLFLIIILALFFNVNGQQTTDNIGIIPMPQQVEINDGHFILDESTVIFDNFEISNILKNEILEITGLDLSLSNKIKKRNAIVFQLKDSIPAKENMVQSYIINVEPNKITIEATTEQGMFYGTQSLKQLIRHQLLTENNLNIPCYKIFDYPSLEYRGWMDDISRGPIPTTDFIKEQIRRLAEYKFNFFNLYTEHLFKLDEYPD
ncbi:MAG: beta-N-acetylhexosaminidase, partial [Bacteroidales bacterium]|nr:beta-N-acetylhexosaminidase [Bacteroidales bacterium]